MKKRRSGTLVSRYGLRFDIAITDKDIRALKRAAERAGNDAVVSCCRVALEGINDNGDPMSRGFRECARRLCKKLIRRQREALRLPERSDSSSSVSAYD
jgi:hypothetical protein